MIWTPVTRALPADGWFGLVALFPSAEIGLAHFSHGGWVIGAHTRRIESVMLWADIPPWEANDEPTGGEMDAFEEAHRK